MAGSQLKQPDLTALWQSFLDCDEAGEGLAPEEFPAWLLLHEPGLARQLPVDLQGGESNAAEHAGAKEHYRCVHRWIHAHRAHRQEEEMALRRKLQQSHPVLFGLLKRNLGG